MKVYDVPMSEFSRITTMISQIKYDGNVELTSWSHEWFTTKGAPRLQVSLRCKNSRAKGARLSGSPNFSTGNRRHTIACCWHVYKDVLESVFTRYPDARIVTKMADYRGLSGFENLYPETGEINVSSTVYPVTMPELCECDPSVTRTTEIPLDQISRYWTDQIEEEEEEEIPWLNVYTYHAGDEENALVM